MTNDPVQPPPQVPSPQGVTLPRETPPTFEPLFAIISAVVLAALAFLLLWRPARTAWDIEKGDWLNTSSDHALAASLSVPLTVLGGTLIMIGTWMALVEWRGRFKDRSTVRERGADIAAVIDAIGKLRGAALVLVIGALLMFASAWVASSAAGTASADSTPSGATGGVGVSDAASA